MRTPVRMSEAGTEAEVRAGYGGGGKGGDLAHGRMTSVLIVTGVHNRPPGAGWLAPQNGVPSLPGAGGQQVWLLSLLGWQRPPLRVGTGPLLCAHPRPAPQFSSSPEDTRLTGIGPSLYLT